MPGQRHVVLEGPDADVAARGNRRAEAEPIIAAGGVDRRAWTTATGARGPVQMSLHGGSTAITFEADRKPTIASSLKELLPHFDLLFETFRLAGRKRRRRAPLVTTSLKHERSLCLRQTKPLTEKPPPGVREPTPGESELLRSARSTLLRLARAPPPRPRGPPQIDDLLFGRPAAGSSSANAAWHRAPTGGLAGRRRRSGAPATRRLREAAPAPQDVHAAQGRSPSALLR